MAVTTNVLPRQHATASSSPELELILPFAENGGRVEKATAYRSTWVISSLAALRDRGHEAAYFRALPQEHHLAMQTLVAGIWLPMSFVRAHYEACDQMRLPHKELVAIGHAASDKAQGTLLQTAVRMAKAAGVTPWTIVAQYGRLFHRSIQGGGIAVYKAGPKEAQIHVVGLELLEIPYFRTAFAGVFNGVNALFCRTSYVHVVSSSKDEATYRFQWA